MVQGAEELLARQNKEEVLSEARKADMIGQTYLRAAIIMGVTLCLYKLVELYLPEKVDQAFGLLLLGAGSAALAGCLQHLRAIVLRRTVKS